MKNNIDNCKLEPIYEISYIIKFDAIFDNENYLDFYSPQIMRAEIIQKYNRLILGLDKND